MLWLRVRAATDSHPARNFMHGIGPIVRGMAASDDCKDPGGMPFGDHARMGVIGETGVEATKGSARRVALDAAIMKCLLFDTKYFEQLSFTRFMRIRLERRLRDGSV